MDALQLYDSPNAGFGKAKPFDRLHIVLQQALTDLSKMLSELPLPQVHVD